MTGRPLADRLAAAYAAAERLLAEGRRVEVLDRFAGLGADAGRAGVTAEVLARNGVVAIVPYAEESIGAVRARHAANGTRYVEIRVAGRGGPQDSAATVCGLLAGVGETGAVQQP
ncbi:hypothetical protein [Streptomyces dysideae]|uniref:Uncharacterized protein n=1 Tax=Streptomyces dysideae TaxID=909626 RepID=A0A117S0Y4_9ACTN|nr:hypothetical protein [Streptomyces dysideae]KUO19939.1 hypothetical protein AQJ91_17515 [Streptomyces dysideae]